MWLEKDSNLLSRIYLPQSLQASSYLCGVMSIIVIDYCPLWCLPFLLQTSSRAGELRKRFLGYFLRNIKHIGYGKCSGSIHPVVLSRYSELWHLGDILRVLGNCVFALR